jgi:hypothetical protein
VGPLDKSFGGLIDSERWLSRKSKRPENCKRPQHQ